MSLLRELNEKYLSLHTAKEDAFWSAKMHLRDSVPGEFEKREVALQSWIADSSVMPKIRQELEKPGITQAERVGLEGWLNFFRVNAIEDRKALELQAQIIEAEGELQRTRRHMKLGYHKPETGEFVEAATEVLSLLVHTSKEEPMRKAAWEGFRSIERHLLQNGFLEVVNQRNQLGRLLGYEDYYDYKVNMLEGFSKKKLFELLDDLEKNTRSACQASIDRLATEKGDMAREPWNFGFLIAGELTKQMDPYFSFETAVERWGRSFSALGVKYGGATLTLDLVTRKGKYENGFMHGPVPAYLNDGAFVPARINFTANAVPGQVGSGYVALETLLHEGGHAAHFSNIRMPAPCFSQEFPPSSMAFAETQSMFMDSLASDADWGARYAKRADGQRMPLELVRASQEKNHKYLAYYLRSLMAVSYAEKAIYEMPEEKLNAENVLSALRDVEHRLLLINSSARPILAIPHLLSREASASYHGYVLAQMAVFQTRDYFFNKYGYILDNPAVGKELAEKYWRPGNAKTFLELVENLTGEPFSAKASVKLVNKPMQEIFEEAESAIAQEKQIPKPSGPIELDAKIYLVHGDELIATNTKGDSFEAMAAKYGAWIREKAKSNTH